MNSVIIGKDDDKKEPNLSYEEKVTIGSLVSFAVFVAIVITLIHCFLKKMNKRVWFLGARQANSDEEERATRYTHPAF